MNTATTFKHWMHHLHDSGARAACYSGHLLHERSFWIILAFVALTAGLFALIAYSGYGSAMQEYYRMPLPPIH